METVFYLIQCILGVPFFSKGEPLGMEWHLGGPKAGWCGKRALYTCFGMFGRLAIELFLRWGVVLAKAESFFCVFTLVGDQIVYKRWSFDLNRFY